MKREQGFYWVKWSALKAYDLAMWIEDANWAIDETGYWIVTGSMSKLKDKDFCDINETRIKNPDETNNDTPA